MPSGSGNLVLVAGATGYVGGRLVPALLKAGYQVRILVRDPGRLQGAAWLPEVEVVQGDVLNPESLPQALAGVGVAYYLVHSMRGRRDFHRRDVQAARDFGVSAHAVGVSRLIYLGGLGDPQTDLSQHLRSRHETGRALREGGVPVTEFRAAIIVGSGSVSFEMIRYLAERLPVMICPRWVYTEVQPIAIDDVVRYLIAALETPASTDAIIEIGGADVLTYREMLTGYARARGLRRWLIPVPVLTPRLSSYWVHWMTPIPAAMARPLVEGLRNKVVVRDSLASTLFPEIRPVGYGVAVQRALEQLGTGHVETAWSDALASSQGDSPAVRLVVREGMILERRRRRVAAPEATVFGVVSGIGGDKGWFYANWAWRIRGMLDRLIGGVGFRRGRREPETLRPGDAVDFWRVETVVPGRLVRLRAEMMVPGQAWLQFEIVPGSDGGSVLEQTAFFAPRGLSGLVYWYSLYPIHSMIFAGLIRQIARRAEAAPVPPAGGPERRVGLGRVAGRRRWS